MREFRTYGSVRGALSNERSYRDSLHSLRSLRSLRSDNARRVRGWKRSATLRAARPAALLASRQAPAPDTPPRPRGLG